MAVPRRKPDVLAITNEPDSLQCLVLALRERHYGVDVVSDVDHARAAFFACGGHDAVVLGPDLSPSQTKRLLECLRGMDAHLPVVAFGEDPAHGQGNDTAPFTRLASYHPASRAGVGAVLKALHAMG